MAWKSGEVGTLGPEGVWRLFVLLDRQRLELPEPHVNKKRLKTCSGKNRLNRDYLRKVILIWNCWEPDLDLRDKLFQTN